MLDWLQHHRRIITAAFCLLVVTLIVLMLVFALVSGKKTFINAWYV